MTEKDKFEKDIAKLTPEIEKFTRAMHDQIKDPLITGFILDTNSGNLVKFTNYVTTPEGFYLMNYLLIELTMDRLKGENLYNPGIHFAEVVSVPSARQGKPLDEIAEELAKEVLVTGLESGYADKAIQLAQDYLNSRKG